MASYKGIKFAKGYNRPFDEFKKEFENTHVFKSIPSKEREAELKKAHKIATKNVKLSNSKKKSGKADTSKDK